MLANFIKFNGGKESGNIERDVEHFRTIKSIYDPLTSLYECYQEHVIDKMIAKLEEFQERDSE